MERKVLDRPDVKPIALDRVSRLPWVTPPAGYIVLIQDVAYGSRYMIARHQQLDRRLMRRGADFPFETRVLRIWQADDAAAAERDLHYEIAAGTTIGEWFDLYQFPTASSASASQYESVSLRDLAQHSGDAESLLQDAKIVGAVRHRSTPHAPAGDPASTPQTSAPAEGRAATTRGPRRLRWAFVLGLFVLAGFFLAERSGDIRRAINSVWDPSSRPAISNRAAASTSVGGRTGSRSTLPTPKVEGRGEVFYTETRANARACANLSCKVLAVLSPGAKIVAKRYAEGQRVNGSDRWIRFYHDGKHVYLHSGHLTRTQPKFAAIPTAKPTQIRVADDGQGEVFYVVAKANARICALLSCAIVEVFERGTRITALRHQKGQLINGSDRWIRFINQGWIQYVHSSFLSREKPTAVPTAQTSPTQPPLQDEYKAQPDGQVFYVKSGLTAKVRNCASSHCVEVGALPADANVQAVRVTKGQAINGNNEWIMFYFDGWNRFVHSGDLSTLKPRSVSTAAATAIPAVTELPPTATELPSTATFTATIPPPTATATVPPAAKYVVETAGNVNANIRSCPRTSCEIVEKFGPGTEVAVVGSVTGEIVYDTDIWLEIRLESGSAFIHSELVTEPG